jgi:hypothetical protein
MTPAHSVPVGVTKGAQTKPTAEQKAKSAVRIEPNLVNKTDTFVTI